MKITLRIITVLFGLLCVLPVLAQSNVTFPTVTATEFSSLNGDYFAISNNADYIYLCAGADVTCKIYERSSGSVVLELQSSTYATWSADGRRLVALEGVLPCEAPDNLPNVRLFDPMTGSASQACLPFAFAWLDWSPINTNVFTVDDQTLFDFSSSSVSSYTPTITVDAANLSRFVGYGALLWDTTTGHPAALINLNRAVEPGSDVINTSVFEICATRLDQCVPLVDTLSYTPADVFYWQLNGRWLLWAGHLAAAGSATLVSEDPASYNDTVFYVTNIFNGETQEVFRFSNLGDASLYARWNVSWSPDRNVIALAVGEVVTATPVARPTLGPAPEARRMLLLTLDWGG